MTVQFTHFTKFILQTPILRGVVDGCTTAKIGCGDCKAKLCANIEEKTKIPRERKKELLNNSDLLDSIIKRGVDKARDKAQNNMKQIREWMKF